MLKLRINLAFILLMVIICSSCSKDEVKNSTVNDLNGNWDVVDYAKYEDGETVVFEQGKPYWHLKRYSQGISIEDTVYYYRYGSENEPNITDYDVHGKILILDNNVTFDIGDDSIRADVIQKTENSLWIKYHEGIHTLEFKYIKN